MSDFWNKFGTSYDEINQRTGGFADFIKNAAQKVGGVIGTGARAVGSGLDTAANFLSTNPVTAPVYGGMQAIANTFTGGLQGAVNRKIDPAGAAQIQQVQGQHPVATGIGQGVGLAGQTLATPLAKVAEVPSIVGSVLPAIGKEAAGAVAAAGKWLPTVGRNILNAAGINAPSVIAQGIDTGNWNRALGQGLVSTALGGAVGSVFEKGISAASRAIPAIKRFIQNAALEGNVGIQQKPFKQVVTGIQGGSMPGSILKRAPELKDDIIDIANATKGTPMDISTEIGKTNFINEMDRKWDTQVDQTFNNFKAQGGKISDLRNEIYADPNVKNLVDAHPELIDNLDSIINTASNKGQNQGIGAARGYLRDQVINFGKRQGASDEAYLSSQLGQSVHDAIDDHFVPDQLKEEYASNLLIKKVLSSEELKIPKVVRSGSQTAARLLTHAVMTGATGAIPGAAAVGIGGIVNDVLGEGLNKVIGKAATAVSPALRGMTGEALAQTAGAIASRVAQATGAVTNAVMAPQTQGQQTASLPAPDIADQAGLNVPASDPMKQSAGTLIKSGADTATLQNISDRENTSTPQQVADARAAVHPDQNPTFQQMFEKRTYQLWKNDVSPYKLDYPTFLSQMKEITNDFDPRSENTAKLLAGKDYKNYLKSYNVALNLQSLGKDLNEAIFGNTLLGTIEGGGSVAKFRQTAAEHDRLVNTIWTAMTGDMKPPKGADKSGIETRLRQMRSAPDKYKALIDFLETEGQVNFNTLRQYGMMT